MITYISLLRGINVSGKNQIKMDDLKRLIETIDFKNVRTYIQSGNVVFQSEIIDLTLLSRKIEQEIKNSFDFYVSVIMRKSEDLQRIIKRNTFMQYPYSTLYVTFLTENLNNTLDEELIKAKNSTEEYFVSKKEIFLLCPNGYGKTKLSNSFIENITGITATTRNWKTVNMLNEIANGLK